jgi:pimeloyl-ACP methyl ester carboxylesterase
VPTASVGDVSLDYDVRGSDGAPTLLLAAGLGAQRIWYPEELLVRLADRGLRVVTYDNRDAGRSTVLDHLPGGARDVMARLSGDPHVARPYGLEDLAADAIGLLDHLGVDRAHVAGASMGGMIAQHLAFGVPERVLSLTSIMSNTGSRGTGQSTPEAMEVLLTAPPRDLDGYVQTVTRQAQALGSPGLVDAGRVEARARLAHERGYHPRGTTRQFLAILHDGDRTERLRTITVPTLVIHGTADPLIQPDGGRATAEAVPGARLVEIEGMGHDLPLPLVDRVADLIADHVADADSR